MKPQQVSSCDTIKLIFFDCRQQQITKTSNLHMSITPLHEHSCVYGLAPWQHADCDERFPQIFSLKWLERFCAQDLFVFSYCCG